MHEESYDPPGHLSHHPLDLGVLGRREGVEAKSAVRPWRVDAVKEQRVEVDVQVEGVTEALHDGDRAALTACHAPLLARPTPQRSDNRAHEDAQDGAREWGVVGEAVAEREGKREHPLPHRDLGHDPVHQVRGRICHAPAAARRAEAAAFAGEGDDPVESAAVAMHPHESVGEDPAAQEAPELALDEPWHRALAGQCLGEKGLELRLDRAVEHALLRSAAGVGPASTAAVSVRRLGGNGCMDGHAARPLPGPYRMRDAWSARDAAIRGQSSPRVHAQPPPGVHRGGQWIRACCCASLRREPCSMVPRRRRLHSRLALACRPTPNPTRAVA